MADELNHNHEEPKEKKEKSKKRKEQHSVEEDATTVESESPKRRRPSESEDASSPNKGAVQNETKASTAVWSLELDRKLIEAVESLVSSVANNESAKPMYPKDINWDAVSEAFEGMNAKDVRARWTSLSTKVRKLRTVEEIVMDVKILHQKGLLKPSVARQRKTVDPNLPKKPATAFFIFLNEKRARLHEKYPELGAHDLSRKLGKKWRELPEEKKQKYVHRYKHGLQQYHEELLKYLEEHFPDEKPPATAFELWKVHEQSKIRKERPDISEKKLNKKLRRRWENLDETLKSAYEKKAGHLLSTFQKKLLNGTKAS